GRQLGGGGAGGRLIGRVGGSGGGLVERQPCRVGVDSGLGRVDRVEVGEARPGEGQRRGGAAVGVELGLGDRELALVEDELALIGLVLHIGGEGGLVVGECQIRRGESSVVGAYRGGIGGVGRAGRGDRVVVAGLGIVHRVLELGDLVGRQRRLRGPQVGLRRPEGGAGLVEGGLQGGRVDLRQKLAGQ